jgi:hypothetical protein
MVVLKQNPINDCRSKHLVLVFTRSDSSKGTDVWISWINAHPTYSVRRGSAWVERGTSWTCPGRRTSSPTWRHRRRTICCSASTAVHKQVQVGCDCYLSGGVVRVCVCGGIIGRSSTTYIFPIITFPHKVLILLYLSGVNNDFNILLKGLSDEMNKFLKA